RRKARVDRVPAIALGYAAYRHVGVADGLELLHSVAGDYVVKRAEILIKNTTKRRRLCLFGQDRKPLEVREQNRSRAGIFRLHLAALLKLLRDWRRQQVVEE